MQANAVNPAALRLLQWCLCRFVFGATALTGFTKQLQKRVSRQLSVAAGSVLNSARKGINSVGVALAFCKLQDHAQTCDVSAVFQTPRPASQGLFSAKVGPGSNFVAPPLT